MTRFKINGDGTVTDTKTGLMWSQDDVTAETCDYWDAEKACANLDLAGHKDWRLPDPHELQSIVDYSRTEPAIDATAFPDCGFSWYWTGTNTAWSSDRVWAVNFDSGDVGLLRRYSDAYARAVRYAY